MLELIAVYSALLLCWALVPRRARAQAEEGEPAEETRPQRRVSAEPRLAPPAA